MATFLQTDFAEGAKASRDALLAPIQTQEGIKQLPLVTQKLQAEVSRIPMETQKLQQSLEKGQLDMQKERIQTETETLRLSELVKGIKEEAGTKDVMETYYADPTKRALSPAKQLAEIGGLLGAKGNLKAFKDLSAAADLASEREERALKMQGERKDRELETLYQVGKFMTPDTIDTYVQTMRTAGIPEQQVGQVMQLARQAAARDAADGGTKNFDQFKKLTVDTYGSLSGRAARAKEAKDLRTADIAQQRIDQQADSNARRERMMIAAIQNKDDIATDKLANEIYRSANTTARDANVVLSNVQKARTELAPQPSRAWFGDESDAYVKWQEAKADLDEREAGAKQSLAQAKKEMETARRVASPKMQGILSVLGDASKETKPPKPTSEVAPTSGTLARRGTKESPIIYSSEMKSSDFRDGDIISAIPRGETTPILLKWDAKEKKMVKP